MFRNTIYKNYLIEILKTFFTIIIGLTLVAITVRAVNFLELIVDSGYSLSTYFTYSLLNIFGIMPKFFPLAFLISLVIFVLKHLNNSEFVILWTAGVKKKVIVNLLLLSSLIVMLIYFIFSIYLTPLALNKSREMLSQSQFNSFLPTIRSKKFLDSFSGLTFFVEKKINNEIKNIFLHDTGKNLKNFSSSTSDIKSTIIIAEKGLVEKRGLFLINGEIISNKKSKSETEIIKFEQLNIDLQNLKTNVIILPKLQETSTAKLLSCFLIKNNNLEICNKETKKEIIPVLIRRLILPFYIPIIALLCSLLIFNKKNSLSKKVSIYFYSFFLLVLTELVLKYTGINNLIRNFYIIFPMITFMVIYAFIMFRLTKD